MKKIVLIALLSVFALQVSAQSNLNYGEYKSQYLLPECPIDTDFFKAGWIAPAKDILQISSYASYQDEGFIRNVAMSYHTDTTLKIIGIATLMPDIYMIDSIGRLGIMNNNFNFIKKVNLPQSSICNYEYIEVLFDDTLNIVGDFWVATDFPQPDSNMTNDELKSFNEWFLGSYGLTVIVGPNLDTSCTCKIALRYYQFSREHWTSPTSGQWTVVGEEFGHDAFYLFPIVAELPNSTVTDTTNTSRVANLDVDKFTFLFPNPTKENLTVHCSYKMKNIEIYNSSGQKVEKFVVDGYHKLIDVKNYPKGNFIIKINTNSGSVQKKFIIE
ncbi:MAG: T9SS type A sorting domain-containing protein [Bacteroidales bacterium]